MRKEQPAPWVSRLESEAKGAIAAIRRRRLGTEYACNVWA